LALEESEWIASSSESFNPQNRTQVTIGWEAVLVPEMCCCVGILTLAIQPVTEARSPFIQY